MYSFFYLVSVFLVVELCLGKSIDYAPAVQVPVESSQLLSLVQDSVETAVGPEVPLTAESIFAEAPIEQLHQTSVVIKEPLPVEVAPVGVAIGHVHSEIGEVINYPVPSISYNAPVIDLPKDAQEVVDIPHANIELPGNSLVNQDLHLNLPSPVIEAPKPIIRNKDVIFRVPQPVFYIPKPVIQHKPMVYRMGHTVRTLTPVVKTKLFVFQIPQAEVTGKSAYTQPIPETHKGKSIL